MFHHVVFDASNYQVSRDFFVAALEPLGAKVVSEGPMGVEIANNEISSLCIRREEKSPSQLHLAFIADSREQVDNFYQAALQAGGVDNGAPGLRPEYAGEYYAAFVIGPDGHNVEAVYQQ